MPFKLTSLRVTRIFCVRTRNYALHLKETCFNSRWGTLCSVTVRTDYYIKPCNLMVSFLLTITHRSYNKPDRNYLSFFFSFCAKFADMCSPSRSPLTRNVNLTLVLASFSPFDGWRGNNLNNNTGLSDALTACLHLTNFFFFF